MMLALFHKPLIHCILAWTEIALSTLLTIKKKKKKPSKISNDSHASITELWSYLQVASYREFGISIIEFLDIRVLHDSNILTFLLSILSSNKKSTIFRTDLKPDSIDV